MRTRLTVPLLLLLLSLVPIAALAQASSTQPTGTFTLSDPSNLFGQGNVSLTNTNATFAATATPDPTIAKQFDAFQFAATPTGSGSIWTFEFDNGGNAVSSGTFTIDAATTNAALSLATGANTDTCQAALGTVTVTQFTTDPNATTTSVFTNLAGTFSMVCANADASLSGTFSFTAPSSTPGPTPNPTPSGGTGSGQLPVPRFLFPPAGSGSTPSETPTPPTPTLTVSGPIQSLLGPIEMNAGDTITLPFTITTSSLDSDVTLTAASDPEGLDLTLSPTKISAPGTGTTNLTISTAGVIPGDYNVTVSAAGGGLTASRTVGLQLFCDPPVIVSTDQPADVTIANGRTATLTVSPIGSGPLTYQWYEGFRGFTDTPVGGATAATFTTPPLTGSTQYWVRVWNVCGSVDSNTVNVTVTH